MIANSAEHCAIDLKQSCPAGFPIRPGTCLNKQACLFCQPIAQFRQVLPLHRHDFSLAMIPAVLLSEHVGN